MAGEQHQTVAFRQLTELGFTRREIERLARVGWLQRLYRGVYAIGRGAVTAEARWMAAVLACGPTAALCDWSAAAHWGHLQTTCTAIDVVVVGHRRGHRGIRLRCVRQLDPEDSTVRDGIAITTVPRTLLDLAAVATQRQLSRAVNEAVRTWWLHRTAIEDILSRHQGRPGVRAFRAATAAVNPGTHRTRSDLEDAFLTLCRKHRLPTPDSNVEIAGFEVDIHFPGTRLIVELDSYEYHRTPAEFDADRRKDAALKRTGHELLRVSDAWLNNDPDGVAQTVRQLLERQLELARRREGLALVQAGHADAE